MSSLDLPPGIAWCFSELPFLSIPGAVVFIGSKVLDVYWAVQLPTWQFILALVMSFPLALFLQVSYSDFTNKWAAASHGAVLPPVVRSKLPAGLSVLLGSLHNFKHGYLSDQFSEWNEEFGYTYNIRVLFENRMFTSEPEYIKAILATNFESFDKGHFFKKQMRSLLGTGVFNSDGEMWKFHRSMTRPFFSRDRIVHFDIFDRHAIDAISQLKKRLKEGFPVDIQDLVSRFTMDSATEFLFGQDVRSLSAGLAYPHYTPEDQRLASQNHPSNIFVQAFNEAQNISAIRSRFGPHWRLREFWQDRAKAQMSTVTAFIKPILASAIAKKAQDGPEKREEVEEGDTLLDHLINFTSDEKILLDEILNILLAGRDTTANTLTFAVYMLAEHPDIMQKLREEIISKVGPSKRPTYDDIKDMKYLRAFINETLRLYPAVPFNSRMTNRAVVLPGIRGGPSFYIPANTRVLYGLLLMHRRTDLWGPDAGEFDPDRFIDERLKKYLTPNPFIFLPFNAGPRICLGQQFAYNEVSFFLIRLLQSFRSVSLAVEAQPADSRPPASWAGSIGPKGRDRVRPRSHLTMYALGGMWVQMEEADSVDDI
ncbi:cytochrome P450 monooxygenase pc-3 [Pluteus cervinus]|uniref:Cytochrome P450 monooxygenase pc-3 n=1 Tax=Pluteus cervinus TaxID=181527 RepID=A0ACD3AFP4_9AGAR|nr:cytochrome P450 monooxygenase pc-3 [Pluteus cervinus]